jgi:NAD(P)-dependent dehydrogenase (short-subunit alcohol dehydrogenase family)
VVGRNEAKSKSAAAELAARGARAIAVVADVTDKAAVASMVERIKREFGRIDILVNNAGINIRKAPHDLELEEWAGGADLTFAPYGLRVRKRTSNPKLHQNQYLPVVL